MRTPIKIFSLAVVGGLMFAGPAAAATTVKAIAFIPKNHPVMTQAKRWVDEINAGLKGELAINYVGGPEVVPRYQQIEAVRNGVVGIVFTVTADYQDQLPAVSAFTLSKLTPSGERKSGFYDYMVKLHQKINIRYIGRVQRSPFYLWVNKETKTLADLKGLKMRTGSLYDRFMRKLGIVPVTITSGETYTALERGVVDGFGWPNIGPRKRGWIKKASYAIDLPFFGASNMLALMNLDQWNKLSAGVREKIMAITVAYEPKMVAYFDKAVAAEWKKLDAAGVKRIKFSAADNAKYIDAAYGVEWATIAKKVPGEIATLKRLTGN